MKHAWISDRISDNKSIYFKQKQVYYNKLGSLWYLGDTVQGSKLGCHRMRRNSTCSNTQSQRRNVLEKTPMPLNTFAIRSVLPNGSPLGSQCCLPKFYPGGSAP